MADGEVQRAASTASASSSGSDFQRPVWEKDDNVKNCENCEKEFTVFKRRHHCRYVALARPWKFRPVTSFPLL